MVFLNKPIIMTEKNICRFCEVEFKTKTKLTTHIVCCEFVNKKKGDIYEVVKQLMKQNQLLENEVEKLRKFVEREKIKINVIDYLNNYHFPSLEHPEFIKSLVVQPKHLEAVFEGNIVDGVFALFADLDPQTIPISAFSHKSSFYVYKETSWHEYPQVSINSMFEDLSNKIMHAYRRWERSRPEFNVETEDVQKQKMILFRKVLGTSMSDDNKYSKFRSLLKTKLEKNMKNIVEYEFD